MHKKIMALSFILICLGCSFYLTRHLALSVETSNNVVQIGNEKELRAILKSAKPGTTISLKSGTYSGKFKATIKGTRDNPIILKGPKDAILDAGDFRSGTVLHLDGADFWILEGFTVRNADKGILLDNSNYCILRHLRVTSTGSEAVHFRKFSSHNLISNSTVWDTGKARPGMGEGVYVGSSVNNWPKLTDGKPDVCDYNRITGNHIGPDVRGENVDIKEGTSHGEISDNHFDGSGLTNSHSDKAWVNLKGNNYRVNRNTGVNTRINGLETYVIVPGWGQENVFDDNHLNLTGATGYGIYITQKTAVPNIVYDTNVAINAPKGLTNDAISTKQ